ncbi:hypothetical protein AAC03nite_28380 [Alicyclobacillus acidoterrestris]|nr:hypothetical protein AAC03nite_28380 [Alicyclobacillus acidoterrestris]
MITITIDDLRLESAALIALAEVLKGTQQSMTIAPASNADGASATSRPQRRRSTSSQVATADSATNAEPVADNPSPKEADIEDSKPALAEAPANDIPTVVDLRAKAQEKGSTPEGKKAIKALLEEFESKSISAVPEERRAEFLARLEAI